MATTTRPRTAMGKDVYPRRQDNWWVEPLITAVVLGGAGLYGLWAAFQGTNYKVGPYLSPLYAPEIHLGFWPLSPAFLILWIPLGFRATCYYYRKAYYRAFFWDPPACAIPEGRRSYVGEARLPFILQNIHRYFLYLALIFVVILFYDAFKAFFFDEGFGVGLGTVILLANAILLAGYTFSCHSFRHLVGGNVDCFSCSRYNQARHSLWGWITHLNHGHMKWAWASLIVVMLADLYVRLVASGVIADPRIILFS